MLKRLWVRLLARPDLAKAAEYRAIIDAMQEADHAMRTACPQFYFDIDHYRQTGEFRQSHSMPVLPPDSPVHAP